MQKRIWDESGTIHYEIGDSIVWQLPTQDIAVVGEYTDPNGPYVDDYFLVFVTTQCGWYHASAYADGLEKVLNDLGELLGVDLTMRLVRSTDYNSRVMWPQDIEGKQLFEFIPIEPSGFLEKVKSKLIPEYNIELTKVVSDYVRSAPAN